METVRFNTIVGADQVIHLPDGLAVPPGPCEVTVTPAGPAACPSETLPLGGWDWLLALAAEAERTATSLSPDLAENHDFYAHGKPRE